MNDATATTELATIHERSLAKGLLAGAVAGLAATAVKTFAEKFYPPRTHGEPEPPSVLAEKLAGHPLDGATQVIAEETIHWGFGAVAGAVYGALAEFYPAATAKDGASFGLALATLTHGNVLPAMGLSAEPEDQTTREKFSEMSTHVMFGVVAETVRRNLRKLL